jgi:hypothetical protein
MLKLRKDLPKAKTPHEQESIQRQLDQSVCERSCSPAGGTGGASLCR